MTELPHLVLDAAAYRKLARDAEPAAVRDLVRAMAAADRARGREPAASPFALWSLLADAAAVVTAPATREEQLERGRRGPTEAEQTRAARARVALVACIAHCERDPRARATGSTQPIALVEDPDTRLCRAMGVAPPPGLAAWNEYLASLAVEIAASPSAETVRRVAAPLAHVAERAAQTMEDAADEMQDAVLAAYDAASVAWDDDVPDEARQEALADPAALDRLAADASAEARLAATDVGAIGEPLLIDLLRRDPLLRAVATGRVARAQRFAGARDDTVDLTPEASAALLAAAARVVEHFPAGLALGRELLRRVIAGDVEVGGRARRRWLWDLHAAYGVLDEEAVTGSDLLGAALGPSVPAVESLAVYRARSGT